PLEVRLDATRSFAQRALALQQQVYRDAQHLRWGGIEVMRLLNQTPERFGCAPLPFVIGSGLFMDKMEVPEFACLETSQVMLDHQFWELTDGRYYFVWDVLESFFPAGLLDAMGTAYLRFLEQLADDADMWQRSRIDFLPSAQLLIREKVTPIPQPIADYRLESLLKIGSRRQPQATAVCVDGQSLSYQALAAQSTVIANGLRRAGVAQGELVGVVMTRSTALMAAVYGVLSVGAAYVPIEPTLPAERRQYLLANSQANRVLTQQTLVDKLTWPTARQILVVEDLLAQPAMEPGDDTLLSQHDLAYVIYTSGSTGQPKGVMIDHRGVINTIEDVNRQFDVSAKDSIFGVSSFGFDLSVYDIFGSIASGATLVYPSEEDALNPSRWLDIIHSNQITIWNSAPPLASLLVETAATRNFTNTSMRVFLLSGDWIPIDLPDRLRAVFPNAKVVSLGGATEASIWSIWYEIDQVDKAWNSIPYGYPMTNQPWFILDGQGRSVADWVVGDLYIGGAGLAKGYWQDADKTAASFIAHPQTGERIYRTGDLGRYHPSGYIEFMGRSDSQVKIQGHRIELGEIETVLNQRADVESCVVLVSPKQVRGLESMTVFYVPENMAEKDKPPVNEALLKTYLSAKLPEYMVPQHWRMLDKLPLTNNGKIDRKKLANLQLPLESVKRQIVAPTTPLEKTVFSIWEKALRISDFGIDDDFFDLGGQSFEAVMVIGQVREQFGVLLSLGDIWQLRTVAQLVKKIAKGDSCSAVTPLIQLDGSGTGEPLFLVHPAGGNVLCYRTLAQQLNRPVFGLQAPGIKGEAQPLQSIRAFANAYAPLIEQQQTAGKIFLGGWSSGALIAYEIAAQLQRMGRDVAGIVMLDSPAPLVHEEVADALMFKWFLADLGLSETVLASAESQDYTGMSAAESVMSVCQILKNHGEFLGEDPRQLELIFTVFEAVVRASRNYYAPIINVDIKLFRAQTGIVAEFSKHPYSNLAQWGWQEIGAGSVDAEYVPGNHYTLLNEPGLSQIVGSIDQWVESLKNK
ncbi:MAG: amino acid adenylation domain-containing protein, partial [Cellvibrionaceae bacterium]|nr:amino acid adenylation domain-containing protein [Cellvibrionaceae bacterium]